MFFSILKFWFSGLSGLKGQKMAQNDKNSCLSHSVSQEPYIIWLWFLVNMCKMMISPANFFIFQSFDFGVYIGVKGQKMTWNYQFQYVLPYVSGIVDHIDHILKILIMISTGVFLYFFFKKYNSSTVFLIIICFSSSSINGQKKFWSVPHLLHMSVIFFIF